MSGILRWRSSSPGRSRIVAHAGLVWTVANAATPDAPFEAQVDEALAMLEGHLAEAGTRRGRLLSVQVLLADIALRPRFDARWTAWIGPDPQHWPQRACWQAALAPGLLVELVATAAGGD
jgi:enamine deaminase RidA (YjgF/YER057c/UK114 family)